MNFSRKSIQQQLDFNFEVFTLPLVFRADSVRPNLSRILNFWLWNGWNCLVTFQCMLVGRVSLTDFSGGQSGWNITKPAGKSTGKSNGVRRKVQWTAAESPMDPNGQ